MRLSLLATHACIKLGQSRWSTHICITSSGKTAVLCAKFKKLSIAHGIGYGQTRFVNLSLRWNLGLDCLYTFVVILTNKVCEFELKMESWTGFEYILTWWYGQTRFVNLSFRWNLWLDCLYTFVLCVFTKWLFWDTVLSTIHQYENISTNVWPVNHLVVYGWELLNFCLLIAPLVIVPVV